jgi:hypothetical protein
MSTLLGRGVALLSAVALTAALAAGCGDEESSATAPPTGPETSGAPPTGTADPETGACGSVIPPDVLASLGWDPAEPVEDRGGCLATSAQGTILVVQVGEGYDAACDRLRSAAPGSTYRPSVDNAAGYEACGFVRDGDLGQSELVVTDAADRVVSVGVAALEKTDPERVRAALLELTGSVADLP